MSNSINFESIYGKPQEQEFIHENNGEGRAQSHFQEEENHVINLHPGPSAMTHRAGISQIKNLCLCMSSSNSQHLI